MEVTFLNVEVNLLLVLLSGVLVMLLGAVYYNPKVLGGRWMGFVGLKESDISSSNAMKSIVVTFLISLLGMFVVGFVYPYVQLVSDYSEVASGLLTGFLVWIPAGYVYLMNTLYAMRPFKLWLLDTGYSLSTFLIAGLVFAVL